MYADFADIIFYWCCCCRRRRCFFLLFLPFVMFQISHIDVLRVQRRANFLIAVFDCEQKERKRKKRKRMEQNRTEKKNENQSRQNFTAHGKVALMWRSCVSCIVDFRILFFLSAHVGAFNLISVAPTFIIPPAAHAHTNSHIYTFIRVYGGEWVREYNKLIECCVYRHSYHVYRLSLVWFGLVDSSFTCTPHSSVGGFLFLIFFFLSVYHSVCF